MELEQIKKRAMEVRARYDELNSQHLGRGWNQSELMQGFIVDVGELMELVMAKEGTRKDKSGDIEQLLKEEISDCLWCLIVLAERYGIDLAKAFMESMDRLDKRVDQKLKNYKLYSHARD